MKRIVTCREMKALDERTIEEKGMPSMVLMERAALAVTEVLERDKESLGRVLVVCGRGNNGGDGLAVARLLHLKHYSAEVYLLGDPKQASRETRRQEAIARNYRVPFVNNPNMAEYTTIVDAIFGIGLTREVSGEYARIIREMNASFARKVAVDLPSGLDGDKGEILGEAVRCRETVTFGFLKAGLAFYPGAALAGEIILADIGIYEEGDPGSLWALEEEDVMRELPDRPPWGNKGTFGKTLILASEKGMAGAGYFSAQGCFASGAGMVKLYTREENRSVLQTLLPEAMVASQGEAADLERFQKELDWCDCLVAGPGLGNWGGPLLECAVRGGKRPLVLDADALNYLGRNRELLEHLGPDCVVTPHVGEMSRLTRLSVKELKADLLGAARAFAEATGAVCVLKDARTVIADGRGRTFLNLSGNSGMAVAGSGDVLSGIIGGLLAQGMPALLAAAFGAYLHGLAGDAAAEEKGERGMLSGDLPDGLNQVLKRLQKKTPDYGIFPGTA